MNSTDSSNGPTTETGPWCTVYGYDIPADHTPTILTRDSVTTCCPPENPCTSAYLSGPAHDRYSADCTLPAGHPGVHRGADPYGDATIEWTGGGTAGGDRSPARPAPTAHFRFPAAEKGPGGLPMWLTLVHEANADPDGPDTFGKPSLVGDWWAGGTVEEYAHARVLRRPDGTVSVASKDGVGARILAAAAARLGIEGWS